MKSLWDLLFPRKCILCGCLLDDEDVLCQHCRKDGPNYPTRKTKCQFLDSYTAVWYYKENVRRSLLRYKFYHGTNLAPAYGRLLAARIRVIYPEGFDLMTWVPTASLRKFRRGYDQAELLAKAVGRELGLSPVKLLKKIRNNRAQSGLKNAAQRRANVVGVYRLTGKASVEGKRILLLDDILTTGATAGECARMLRTAGAKEVHCAVVAAGEKQSEF